MEAQPTKMPFSLLVKKINTRKDAQMFAQYIGNRMS
jgi:hypothetical protein